MYFYYAGRATIPSYAILCYLVHYHKSKLKPINATESTDLINSGAKIRFIEWVVWAEDGGGGTQRILLKRFLGISNYLISY